MNTYTDIAPYYDYLLRHVNYQKWFEYIRSIIVNFGPEPEFIVELGCGTGKFGAKFSQDGYTVYGIDNSLEMLRVAKTRSFKNFRIICADIRKFNLAKKAHFIFSVHDTLNYVTEGADIKKVFKSVYENLDDDGIFLFDLTTEYNILKNFHSKETKYSTRDAAILWSNEYDKEEKIICSTIRIKRKKMDDVVEKHVQRIYSIDFIKELLIQEGFELLHIFGDYTYEYPKKDTIMMNFVTRKTMGKD